MGGLHPRASLYEKPVNLEAAKQVQWLLSWLAVVAGPAGAAGSCSRGRVSTAVLQIGTHTIPAPGIIALWDIHAEHTAIYHLLQTVQAHAEFRRVMREKGVRVLTVR